MAEINLQFTVNSFSSTVSLDSTNVTVTPEATQLTVYPGFASFPPQSTSDTQILFNDAGLFGGSANFTYDKTSKTLKVDNANVVGVNRLGNIANVHINGGTSGQFIKTDGLGNLSFSTISPGGSTTQLQYNNGGEFSGVPSATYSGGRLTLGSTSQVRITGGTNGYVLQTDGTGNLSWTAQTGGGGGGNGHPSGANTQVQFNDAGLFGADAGFTYDKELNLLTADNILATTDLTVNGNANVSGNVIADKVIANSISGNLASGTQLGITQVGTQGLLNVTGDVNAGNLIAANGIYGHLSTLTQANINQVGTLSTLNVTGNVTVGNISASLIDGTLTVGSQPNITQVGTLSTLGVTNDIGAKNLNLVGNIIMGGNLTASGNASITGNISGLSGSFSGAVSSAGLTSTGVANLTNGLNVTGQTATTTLVTTSNLTVGGTTTIQQGKEKFTNNSTAATGTIAFDVLTQAIQYNSTAATGNFTLNFRGNGTVSLDSFMSSNQSVTLTFINSITTNGYIANVFQIDGTAISVKWNGAAPLYGTLTGSAKDVYTFNILKTAANTYIVLGSTGRFI